MFDVGLQLYSVEAPTYAPTYKLTVVYGDTGALVRRQNVASVTATQEAAHCVHTLVVTFATAWVLALVNVCVCERGREGYWLGFRYS